MAADESHTPRPGGCLARFTPAAGLVLVFYLSLIPAGPADPGAAPAHGPLVRTAPAAAVGGGPQAVPLAPVLVAADDWPMYGHDPGRTNNNPAETLLTADNVGQLVARWQVDIGWSGAPPSGAPSVANGRVFVGSSVPDGANFFAFAAETGAPLWSADLGHGAGCFGVGIGATAAISGSMVVAGGGDGAYYGLDSATGAVRWRDPLGAGPSSFAWASPLLTANLAYLGVSSGCDNPSVRGAVRSVNLYDGQVQADQAFVPVGQAGAGIWNSPALSPDGRTLVVATGEDYAGYNGPYNRAIVTLDPASLVIRQASQQGGRDQDRDYATTPVVFQDAQDRTFVAANHKDENFYVYLLDQLDAGPLWQRPSGTIVGMMPAYDPDAGTGGTLFFVDGFGQVNAVDPVTGADRWPAVCVGTARGNLAVADGLIFVNAGVSGLLILDETDGHLLTILVPDHKGKAYSGVAVARGFVYWLSGTYLNAWSLPAAEGPPAQVGN